MKNDPLVNHALSPRVRGASGPSVSDTRGNFLDVCEPEKDLTKRTVHPQGPSVFTSEELIHGYKSLKETK